VKSDGGMRESDGAIVLMIAARNAAGGKDSDFGHAGRGGKRKDMAGTARPSHPDGYTPVANVRQLQNRLWATAKRSSRPRGAILALRCGNFVWWHAPGRRDGRVTMLRRASVSCMRENRTYSSKGGCWKRSNAGRSTAGPRLVR